MTIADNYMKFYMEADHTG